ncbi:MAG TPA: glycoside hydrolase family 2 TIM barrel-domain containing protein [Candidatus Hydrogenedentes bacterium]|nr:glycoside hydrolase family 2 TIM barrel-domain containing protein [Candidatus Hydrogenedentota bacterium]
MRNTTWFMLLSILLLSMAISADENSVGNAVTAQQVISLENDQWRLACDPKNEGRDHEWWKEPVANAQTVPVPNITQEIYPGYHGVSWYWLDMTIPENPFKNGRYLLRFWAVDYSAEVWVNNTPAGGHEGGETPFTLDITQAVKPGETNRIAMRVINPSTERIDGMTLDETPHRNKRPTLIVGSTMNYSGITEAPELLITPPIRIDDVFVRGDWKTGTCRVQVTVRNTLDTSAEGQINLSIGPANTAQTVASAQAPQTFAPGEMVLNMAMQVPQHHLWDLDDPYLYGLTTRISTQDGSGDQSFVRFGFRDLRVERGFFRLNGQRIFVKSSHTGNHCPVGQSFPPKGAKDLLCKDMLYMKSSGFNTVRFIAGIAHPFQLDLCDEIGLMVYEETLAGWCLADSPQMAERFDFSIREMILRDRNHPSATIWGLLNETPDGPVFRHAVDTLKLVRELDDTRLVLLGSGRWDKQFTIGSLCNPGSATWEYEWGVDSPSYTPGSEPNVGSFGGYMNGAGDAHIYPGMPLTQTTEDSIRMVGKGTKPVFLSEYGIGSLMNGIRELRHYEQLGIRADLEDVKYFQTMVDGLLADWPKYDMGEVYPFPEDLLRESDRLHSRQRILGFDLIRSNPQFCGYNLTGLLDHGFTGEGLWSFWREWKPGIVDALQDGWAPLRWCLFTVPKHGYAGRPLKLEAVLANEDVLAAGEYPVTLRVFGPQGMAWEQKTTLTIPASTPESDAPLALPVYSGDVVINGPAGEYTFAANLERGGAPLGGRLHFFLSEANLKANPEGVSCLLWGVDEKVKTWLSQHSVNCAPYETSNADTRQVILVGDLSTLNPKDEQRVELMQRVARGSMALFLDTRAFKRGDNNVGWLPLKNKGRLFGFSDWLYHKECVAKPHPVFEGLAPKGIMDWDYYGPMITHDLFEGSDVPDETAAFATAMFQAGSPGGYTTGVLIGWYRFGEGKFMINTFPILDNLDQHPAADRMLLNMIAHAAKTATGPSAALPAGFHEQLKAVGY